MATKPDIDAPASFLPIGPSIHEVWDFAFAEMQDAFAEYHRYDREVYTPANLALRSNVTADFAKVEDTYMALSSHAHRLGDHLLTLPAPDAAALGWKVAYLWKDQEEEGFCDSMSMELIRPIMADASRLLR